MTIRHLSLAVNAAIWEELSRTSSEKRAIILIVRVLTESIWFTRAFSSVHNSSNWMRSLQFSSIEINISAETPELEWRRMVDSLATRASTSSFN